MGILYDLSKPDMFETLRRSGLTHLTKYHLAKIMEAAILESHRRDRSLVLTGLNMFEREVDGSLVGHTEPLFWTDWPEFGHLQQYKLPTTVGGNNTTKAPLKDQVAVAGHKGDMQQIKNTIRDAFLTFLSQLLGFGVDAFDPSQALAMYGIDSLSGVSSQYWFHKGIGILNWIEVRWLTSRYRTRSQCVRWPISGRRLDREYCRQCNPDVDPRFLGSLVLDHSPRITSIDDRFRLAIIASLNDSVSS